MELAADAYSPTAFDSTAYEGPDDVNESVNEAIERMEPFLKGQGYLPMSARLKVLDATVEDATQVLEIIFRLLSQQQLDDRAREQLRDQADKDRVALGLAQKRNESLEDGNKRLITQVKDLEGKLLAAKHKAEEQERELKQKLQSTTVRLNGYLYGGRDAGKRSSAAATAGGGTAASTGPGGARRAPAYDRFRDDPAEAAAAAQKLEAEMTQLRQQNLRLKKQLAAAREQVCAGPLAGMAVSGAGGSPLRDGQRGDQLATVPEISLVSSSGGHHGNQRSGFDMQSVQNALPGDRHHDLGSPGARTAAGVGPGSPDGDVARLQRHVRELQLNVEHLQRSKQELQRQVDRASGDRSELQKTLHSLRSKCASLEVERKNAEDRFLRAQRATAARLDPVAAEAQTSELRSKLVASDLELRASNSRADGLKQQLAAAEVDVEASQRHVGVLKRAIRALPKGQQALEQLEQLVAQELQPLREQLRDAKAELEIARVERDGALRRGEPSCGGASDLHSGFCDGSQLPTLAIRGELALSPPVPLPSSPTAGFDGFNTRPSTDSPPLLLQPPMMHAFYNRTFAVTMPSERVMPGTSSFGEADDCAAAQQQQQLPQSPMLVDQASPGGATGGGTQPGNVSSGAGGSSAYMRRSVSAGVYHRMGEQYTSAERQRARWQVHNSQARQRFPSPIDIIMEQARNPTSVDMTISITAPIPEGPTGTSSQGSTP